MREGIVSLRAVRSNCQGIKGFTIDELLKCRLHWRFREDNEMVNRYLSKARTCGRTIAEYSPIHTRIISLIRYPFRAGKLRCPWEGCAFLGIVNPILLVTDG